MDTKRQAGLEKEPDLEKQAYIAEQAELEQQEFLDAVGRMTLFDDYLMTLVFDKNIEVTELLLSVLLQRDDLKVLEVEAQREYKNPVPGVRALIIDIYAEDNAGKVYNIEVQRASAGADFRRARFHSSMIDSRMLKAKQDFKEIRDSYVIFITETDVCGAGLPLYHIDRVIRETGAYIGDGSHILYVNGSYKDDSDPVGRLMHDFRCLKSVDMFYPLLASQVRHFKETEGGRNMMGETFEELLERRAEKRAEEKAEKLAAELAEKLAAEKAEKLAAKLAEKTAVETRKESALRMIARGRYTLEEVSEDAGLPIETVKELAGVQLVS